MDNRDRNAYRTSDFLYKPEYQDIDKDVDGLADRLVDFEGIAWFLTPKNKFYAALFRITDARRKVLDFLIEHQAEMWEETGSHETRDTPEGVLRTFKQWERLKAGRICERCHYDDATNWRMMQDEMANYIKSKTEKPLADLHL